MDGGKLELKQRTKLFAGRIVRLYSALPVRRAEVAVLGKQMLRSGTSVAANFREDHVQEAGRSLLRRSIFVRRKRMKLNQGLNYFETTAI